MEIYSIIISAFITIFSLGLFIISITSYQKYKNQKLLFVCLVFLVFLLKGIVLSVQLFTNGFTLLNDPTMSGLFDLMILLLLFIATLKR
jgi:hypothetical protein